MFGVSQDVRELDAAEVGALLGELGNKVRVEVKASTSSRDYITEGSCEYQWERCGIVDAVLTVVYNHGKGTLLSHLGEEGLQRLGVESSGEVSAGDNDRIICACVCGLVTELNGLARASCSSACNDGNVGEPCLVQSTARSLDDRASLCVRQVDGFAHRPGNKGPHVRLRETEKMGNKRNQVFNKTLVRL